jgi:two-component system, chemotaxis family, sensor kinase CheA
MDVPEIDDDDIQAFIIESYENLEQIERDIIDLEKVSGNGESLERIYRSLHTLKGNCGFLPFPKLESLAHAGESLLSQLREQRKNSKNSNLQITPQIISTLLQTVDTIRQILTQIKATKHEGENDYSSLIKSLTQLQETQQIISAPIQQINESLDTSNNTSDSADIRVNVNLLDQMMNLVGELVLTRNQVMGFADRFKDTNFAITCQHLSLITSQLQEGVMKTRLQPISTIWQKFPRIIRDLAIANGKQVEVEMQGSDTELDKSIIEAIKDPLTHLVRNCIDHGIESPSDRIASGKPTTGKIFLKAFYENGKVNLEIGDDGHGLTLAKLKARAQQLGLITPAQAVQMIDAEVINLIFLPGFSTTEQVTNLSGRGVGMDIVKNNVDKINGTIEVNTQPGKGTTFKLKIPLTLTILPALIITIGNERYTIPQTSLQELVRLEPEQAINSIEILYDVPVYHLRANLIPLIDLNQLLNSQQLPLPTPHSPLNLIIIQADNYQFGLVVDTIEDIQDIVVKPLGKQLKSLSIFAGATILGDGTVALVIDVVNLAKVAGVEAKYKQILSNLPDARTPQETQERQMILLLTGPQGAPMGIPITHTYRLEKISAAAVEIAGNQQVIRSYGRILPLIDLKQVFQNDTNQPDLATQTDTLQIVIVSPNSQLSVALVVEQILDIVEESLTVKGIPSRPGVMFCAVIQGQITEILDIEAVIRMTNPYLLQVSDRE